MDRCGQMARLVVQWSQSDPSVNVLCLSLLPRLWGWVSPLFRISSKADVHTGCGLCRLRVTSGTPRGSHRMGSTTRVYRGLLHRLSVLCASSLCPGPSRASCKPHTTPTNPGFQLFLSIVSPSSPLSGANVPFPIQSSGTASAPQPRWPWPLGPARAAAPLHSPRTLFSPILLDHWFQDIDPYVAEWHRGELCVLSHSLALGSL